MTGATSFSHKYKINRFPCTKPEFDEITDSLEQLAVNDKITFFVTWGLGGWWYGFISCVRKIDSYSLRIELDPPSFCNSFFNMTLYLENISFKELVHELNNCLIRYPRYRFRKWRHESHGNVPKNLLIKSSIKIWPELRNKRYGLERIE